MTVEACAIVWRPKRNKVIASVFAYRFSASFGRVSKGCKPGTQLAAVATRVVAFDRLALYQRSGGRIWSNFSELRCAGRIMQQVDIQIGAIARTLPNCVIVSKDSDLPAISGATIENWTI